MGKVKTALARAVVFLKRISLWMISGLIVLPNSAWSSEAALQVAFVYNFAKFIDWPEEVANPSLRLCVVGGSREMHYLENFIPDTPFSPLEQLKMRGNQRQRARNKPKQDVNKTAIREPGLDW